MARYGLFTFNPHSNDCYLNKELINTIHPMLEKLNQYALCIEKCGTPGEHFHLVLNMNGDTSQKLKNKIENKAVTLFIKNRLTETMTKYENAFDYKIIKNEESDKMYTIGYCYKDGYEYKSKGFTQEYITKCIQHYHTSERNMAKVDPTAGWKVLSLRNAHAEIEHFAKKHEMEISDKNIYLRMKEQKISFCQISKKQQDIIHDELVVANKPECKFAVALATKNILEGEVNDYYKEMYQRLIIDLSLTPPGKMDQMRSKIEVAIMREGI
jgi:MarR-like DNA-binding transcriptional regulator SgrR of sgrS sRNA